VSMVVRACNAFWRIPLWLVLHIHLPLGVVADVANFRKAPDIELCRTELRHDGVAVVAMASTTICR
jgi:hypothetical protein